tara:strand:- start:44 stop:430 length:387 start_codon:yes stop_codon:yes gene_type:complete
MKILGIGVDIIKNERIKNSIKNKKFIIRSFTKNEIEIAKKIQKKHNFYAKRFAAKEALAKALGLGFRQNLNFKDIEILNDKNGKPYYRPSNKLNNLIKKRFGLKKFNLFLSISDEKDYSIAFTTLQKL